LYDVLNVHDEATEKEIKMAFLTLAKKYHPDINDSPDAKVKFSEINEAYETLIDQDRRDIYDSTGMTSNEQ